MYIYDSISLNSS